VGSNLNTGDRSYRQGLDGSSVRVGIVCGRFNDVITTRLLDGARRGLSEAGVPDDNILEVWVPGAFEVPLAAKALLQSDAADAVIGLGAVIRGETSHYDFVAGECARGLQDVQLAVGKPAVFGVLTTEDEAQALARSEGPGGHNVGEEGAWVAVEMAALVGRFR
jgi:6,7-dimethyl-8-ribityllumazine synthase